MEEFDGKKKGKRGSERNEDEDTKLSVWCRQGKDKLKRVSQTGEKEKVEQNEREEKGKKRRR